MDRQQDYIKTEFKSDKNRVRRFYEEHKDTIYMTATVVLAVKNLGLKRRNRKLTSQLMESKRLMDDARVQLEALSMFEKYFGPRPRR